MCGLIGCTGPAALAIDPDDLSVLHRVAHRGPDSSGCSTREGGTVWLGHTRLAIQDTGIEGSQPFIAGDVTLTYNGELWHPDRYQLGPRISSSDTEVVARVLDRLGPSGLDHLEDGMWAMAWHDRLTGRVYLARDRWGKVPLYYAQTADGSVWWASEIKALPGLSPRAVPPGHLVVIEPDLGVVAVEEWALETPLCDQEPTPETVAWLLRQGVRERLIGERPVAFLLSGGLDSTLVLALAVEEAALRQEVVAYTAVMDPESRDLRAARAVAAHYNVTLVEVQVPPVTPARVEEAVRAVEAPLKAQVEIALAHLPLMEAVASDGFAVALSGEAADELFGGYGGMQIKAAKLDDSGYHALKVYGVQKMARGNFTRVNKVGMAHGVECRLPFMQSQLVDLALLASKEESPPGKRLLKAAARTAGVPDRIINRPKETFQGAVGTAASARALFTSPIAHYNNVARDLFGFLPKE